MRKWITIVIACFLLIQTGLVADAEESNNGVNNCPLSFDGDLANESVGFQTSLGPRTPGSDASAKLRTSIKENLTNWHITETTHHVDGMVLTNLFATWNHGMGSEVILAAHYDTRDRAERDHNESMRDKPIDGANDGASGVAVLMELARIIPSMNLSYEVTLFFTDGEDQGVTPSFLGARAWSENITDQEADDIESFILVDMVGDSDLTISKSLPGNETLWLRTEQVIYHLDDICDNFSSEFYDNSTIHLVGDDHIYALEKGIPAIDIIDIQYGENASAFGGHWHTHNDTADKVSSESLETIGMIVEYGLLNGTWQNVRNIVENDTKIDSVQEPEESTSASIDENTSIGLIFIMIIVIIWANLFYILIADNQGEG